MGEKAKTRSLSTINQDNHEVTAASMKGKKRRKSIRESDNKVKLMLILFTFVGYVAAFLFLYNKIDSGIGALAVIPVLIVAWLYGAISGASVAVLMFSLNIFLRDYLGQEWTNEIKTAGILGMCATMSIGIIVGHMSDLSMRARKELFQRKLVEEELANHRNHLEELVEERTVNLQKEIIVRKKAEDHLDNIIESSLDCIVVTDSKGNIIRTNKSFNKVFGYTEEEVIGRHATEFSPSEERTYESITGEIVEIDRTILNESRTMVSKLMEEGKIYNWERYFIRKDRKLVPMEVNTVFLYDKRREITGSVGTLRDITERKQMQDKLLQSEKLKSLGELAGGVAHDFNNVLAAILGRAQLLKMATEPPAGVEERRKSVIEMKEGLDVIEQASRDGAETVRRIQEFARRRDDDKHFSAIDLNEIIDNSLDFTRAKWKGDAESKGIEINIQKELSVLPTTSGSAAELREVFTNLINNAVDAMPQGGEIKIKTYKEDGHIVVNVADTGAGIPKALRNKIFDPFFTTKGAQSTGLGMSVSYGIISRHRGTIAVDSIEGRGAAFTIKLPIIKNTIEEKNVKPISGEIKKVRILVIEDEAGVRNLLSAILKKGGHEVETATSGSQGIEVYEKNEFDLVFTDLGMPGMSGWQVAEKVKGINGRVPVVLITGWDIRQEESEMKDSYVDLIVNKPFGMDQVLNVVQEGMILRERFKAI